MLDDLKRIRRIDESDMLGAMVKYPELIDFGIEAVDKDEFSISDPDGLIFLGQGASAIGGDIIADWLGAEIPGGVKVERGFSLSAPIDKDALVICCSYSGNTEETLSMLSGVLKTHKRRTILMTIGGKMEGVAKKNKLPIVRLPPGIQPRASLPAVVSSVSKICDSVGLSKNSSSALRKASSSCKSLIQKCLAPEVKEEKNVAKQVAHQIHGLLPIALTTPGIESVARRWKTQMNENAKQHCFFSVFPEISHNEIVAWLRDERSQMHIALILHDAFAEKALRDKFGKFRDTLKEEVKVIDIESNGGTKIESMMNHLAMSDFTSAYCAILSEIDPSPVAEIVSFKKKCMGA